MVLVAGTYDEGQKGSTGTWTPLDGIPIQPLDFSAALVNATTYYAVRFFSKKIGTVVAVVAVVI